MYLAFSELTGAVYIMNGKKKVNVTDQMKPIIQQVIDNRDHEWQVAIEEIRNDEFSCPYLDDPQRITRLCHRQERIDTLHNLVKRLENPNE